MRRRTAVVAAAALGLVGAGCSSTPEPQQLTVGLVDYAFVDLPGELAAASILDIDNRSEEELHELAAVLLADDETRTAEELLALPPEELGALFADVQTVLLQPPGSDDVVPAVGDGTLTTPGRYLVLCAIPTGADPGEYLAAAAETEEGPPQGVAGGPPHFVNGMWAELNVVE